MTKKRFRVIEDEDFDIEYIADKKTFKSMSNVYSVCDMLNQLHEENEQLKYELHTLTGLYAFDIMGKGVKASNDVVTVPRKDLIKLDYGDVE